MTNHLVLLTATCAILALFACAPVDAQLSPPPRNETNICTGHPLNSLLPNLSDCTRHFRCTATGPVGGQCQTGWRFNSTTLLCSNLPVDCFQCPVGQYFIDMPVDYNCLQFVRCFAGRAEQRTCSEGLLFDPVRRQCNVQREVTCPCPRRDNPARPFFVRKWDSCSEYHVCVNGTAVPGRCPSGLQFNLQIQQCDHPDAVNCNGPSTSGV